MIDAVTPQLLHQLLATHSEGCVSIYLPTHHQGAEQTQDPIRLKNLLAEARRQLVAGGGRGPEADEALAPLRDLVTTPRFWTDLGDGLAFFLANGELQTVRLSTTVEELVVVADHFHIKPLLAATSGPELFYVLALSQNRVRLLRGGRQALHEVELTDVPLSLGEALQFDDRERQLQSHGGNRVGRGRVAASFHGHAMDKDTTDKDVDRFLSAVEAGLRQVMEEGVPVVLAGVDRLTAAYRRTSTGRSLVDETIGGNPDDRTIHELHELAWPIVAERLHSERRRAAERIMSEQNVSSTVRGALVAAHEGKVETLFVAQARDQWGSFDPATMAIEEHSTYEVGDRDLLDIAAVETLLHGGNVHVVAPEDVPNGAPVAAQLRY